MMDVAGSSTRNRSVNAEFRYSACGLPLHLFDELVLTDKYRDIGRQCLPESVPKNQVRRLHVIKRLVFLLQQKEEK